MVLAHFLYSIIGQNQVLKYYWDLNAIKTKLICLECTISSKMYLAPMEFGNLVCLSVNTFQRSALFLFYKTKI